MYRLHDMKGTPGDSGDLVKDFSTSVCSQGKEVLSDPRGYTLSISLFSLRVGKTTVSLRLPLRS